VNASITFGLAISGLGLGARSLFLRWRFPAVPKQLATAGIVISLGLIAWAFFPKWELLYVGPAVLVAAVAIAGLDWLLTRNKPQEAPAGHPAPAPSPATDQRVTSFGQSGGITAHTVRTSDDQGQR
jgi:hypothetical protein